MDRVPASAVLFLEKSVSSFVVALVKELPVGLQVSARRREERLSLLALQLSRSLPEVCAVKASWGQITLRPQLRCRHCEGPVLGQVEARAPSGQPLLILLLLALVSTCSKTR